MIETVVLSKQITKPLFCNCFSPLRFSVDEELFFKLYAFRFYLSVDIHINIVDLTAAVKFQITWPDRCWLSLQGTSTCTACLRKQSVSMDAHQIDQSFSLVFQHSSLI